MAVLPITPEQYVHRLRITRFGGPKLLWVCRWEAVAMQDNDALQAIRCHPQTLIGGGLSFP
jgi:hypothetical protein